MKRSLGMLIAMALISTNSAFAASTFTLAKNYTQKVEYGSKTGTCGYVNNSWIPVTKISGNKYKKNSSATKQYKSACSALLKSGSFKSLSKLPSIAAIAKTKHSAADVGGFSVSGTPPVLSEIGDMSVTTLFWGSGVFDGYQSGTPTQDQCSQFWIGQTDGLSGGMLACTMTEDVGYAFEPVLRGAVSICYMQNLASQTIADSDAVSVASGELPSGGLPKIFNPPSGDAARIVKINTASDQGSQSIFIKVFSDSANSKAGYQYRAKLWFCEGEGEQLEPRHSEEISVLMSGLLKTQSVGTDAYGSFSASTEGALSVKGGVVSFNSNQDRVANVVYRSISEQNKFKARMIIGNDGTITQKFYNLYSGNESKKYSISKVGGDTLQDLRFYEGAFLENFTFNGLSSEVHSGATEYRDSNYVSAPDSDLMSKVSEYAFDSDSFYSALSEVENIDSSLNCTVTPDVELNVDMSNAAMLAVKAQCDANNEQTNNFCRENDSIKNVVENFQTLCPVP